MAIDKKGRLKQNAYVGIKIETFSKAIAGIKTRIDLTLLVGLIIILILVLKS